jgi:DeoR family fructose operon transcriptional repressor
VLRETRLDRILDLVAERGEVTVVELNEELLVSESTIRRDLGQLSQSGRVRRSHGGAVRVVNDREPPLALRELRQLDEKGRIGRAAAELVHAGDRVFLGSGTTVEAMAGQLIGVGPLTVITNSLPVVNRLADVEAIDLIVIGGEFRHTERSMISQVAERMIAEFRVDTVYMGVPAIDVVHGLTADSVAEVSTDRAIMEIARRRVILADHTKFNRVGTVSLAPLASVDLIITDQLDGTLADQIREHGPEVILADAPPVDRPDRPKLPRQPQTEGESS